MFMAGPFIARLAKLLLAWLASLFLAMAGLVRWFVLCLLDGFWLGMLDWFQQSLMVFGWTC